MNQPHPNPRIEAMSQAAYTEWHRNLTAPVWERASDMVRQKFYRMVAAMLMSAMESREAA